MPLKLLIRGLKYQVEIGHHSPEFQRRKRTGAVKSVNQARSDRLGRYQVALLNRNQPSKAKAKGNVSLVLKNRDASVDDEKSSLAFFHSE